MVESRIKFRHLQTFLEVARQKSVAQGRRRSSMSASRR